MIRVSVFALLVLCLHSLCSAEAFIAEYAGNRSAAISFTFDDGFRHQGKEHIKMMQPYDFKGTFFIVVGQTKDHKPPKEWGNRMSWELLRELHADGHEIANHSWSHPALKKSSGAEVLEKEINYAHDVFTQKMGFKPYSFAFPGGSRPKEVWDIAAQCHPMVRGPVLTYGGNRWTTDKANAWIDDAIKERKWIVPMIHAISKGWSAFRSPAEFDEHLKYVKSKENDIWVAPMRAVSQYQQLRTASTLKAKIKKHSASISLQQSGLDEKVYTQPLTVVIPGVNIKNPDKIKIKGDKEAQAYINAGELCIDLTVSQKAQTVEVSWK